MIKFFFLPSYLLQHIFLSLFFVFLLHTLDTYTYTYTINRRRKILFLHVHVNTYKKVI